MPTLCDSRELTYNADCVGFCRIPGQEDLLAAGCYELDECSGSRKGRLYTYRVTGTAPQQLLDLDSQDFPGIFDIKWSPHKQTGRRCLGLALTDGTIRLLQFHGHEHVSQESIHLDDKGLATCIAFPDSNDACHKICGSTSNGFLAIAQAFGAGAAVLSKWKAHDLEIWACAFHGHQDQLLLSGADDCTLKGWDTRSPQAVPAFTNRKAHGAGVCCIQSSRLNEHVVCTGSYDEQIRMWDMRMMAFPSVVVQVGAGGGVWRVQWHPDDATLLLAACMHNGCAIVKSDSAAGKAAVAETYSGHGSLAYGADWCTHLLGSPVIASCSFYDRSLHLWTPDSM